MSGGTEDGNRKMPIILLSPLLVDSFCQGWGEWKRARTQLQKEIDFLLIIKNKTNKNNPVGEKQTGRLDKAGQGWTRQGRAGHKAYIKRRRTNTELQTQGDYKGSK